MPKTIPRLPESDSAALPYSTVVEANGFVFLAGQVGRGPDDEATGDIASETRAALDRVRELLEEVGLGLADIVKVTVYLADVTHFPLMNDVYREYFPVDPPARATVGVAALPGNYSVEIDVIAAR
jgi:2-iminobutanoate/2-iminopropanoate deaminase